MQKRFRGLNPLFLVFIGALLLTGSSFAQENEFTIPMRFEIVGDGVDLGPLELDFDLEAQNSLRMGDILINSKTVEVQIGTVNDLSPALLPYMTEEEREDAYLVMRWPEPLLTEGVVEAISQSGRVLWKAQLTKQEMHRWKDFQSELRDRVGDKMRRSEVDAIPMMNATWAFKSFLRNNADFVNTTDPFRFCLTQNREDGQSRLCLPYMEFLRKDRRISLQKTPEPVKPARIILNQKQSALKIRQAVKPGSTIQFLADLSEGHIYEFTTKPPQINIEELVRQSPNLVKVVGYGQVPSQAHLVLNPKKKNFLIESIGWDQTIGDFREFWETKMAEDNPTLYFRGDAGGMFRQDFKIKRLPREEIRPWLHRRTLPGTYVDGKSLYGIKSAKTQIASTEQFVEMKGAGPDEFKWNFLANNRGEMNESRLIIRDGKETFKAYAELFKGFPGEVGFRVPLILGTGGNFLVAGEIAGNYWLDSLGGWQNYYLSNQRWGFGAKLMQTLTNQKLMSRSNDNPDFNKEYSSALRTFALDLKYRLTPGLWNRDETFGLILGFNKADYDFFNASMIGTGAFWARSMPKVFDDLINKFPFMRYPKFVDMEFIYYLSALNKDVATLRQGGGSIGNWALNFHGKVHWKKSFFGEAGFGMKSLDYLFLNKADTGGTFETERYGYRFFAVYSTVGLGYQF